MGHQIQESQIATYQRRTQREAPGTNFRTLFEQDNDLRQNYTVSARDGVKVNEGDMLHAIVRKKGGVANIIVTDCNGRTIGGIVNESGRVLSELLKANRMSVVTLKVSGVNPVSGDLQVRIVRE